MEFPVELLPGLAKHVGRKEMIKWRLVCKTWRRFIDEFCLQELILFVRFYPTLELWQSNSEPIDLQKAIVLTSDRCFSEAGFRYTFRNVKKLFLVIRNDQKAHYQMDFPKLEHLEIIRHNSSFVNYYPLESSPNCDEEKGLMEQCNSGFELNLKSLKTLYVNVLCDNIVLDCPNLSQLSFHLIYPSSNRPIHYKQIRKLTCFYYHRWFAASGWIKELENLESLVCHSYSDHYDPAILKYFPRLKFLYFYCCNPSNVGQIEREKIQLEREDLKIFYFGKIGLEFLNINVWQKWLNWSIYDMSLSIAFYYKSDLTKLAPTLPTARILHYDKSFLRYDRRFFEKLINVQALNITQETVSQAQIVELIGWLKNIVLLWLNEGKRLDQNFYNLLPECFPYLRVIHIDNRELTNLDLNFLLELKHLYRVEFKSLPSAENYPGYKKLVEKVAAKRREIVEIGGEVLFEMDEVKLELDNFETFDYYRAHYPPPN